MERDPLRLVWRTAPLLNLAGFGLLLLAGALLLLGLDLVRLLVEGPAADARLLRLAVPLPQRFGGGELVLLPGLPVGAGFVGPALLAVLALVPPLVAALLAAAQAVGAGIGGRIAVRLRGDILDRVLAARPSARDDAERAAAFAGESLSRENGFLGSALLTGAQSAGIVVLALLYAGTVDPRLAFAAGILVVAGGLLGLHRLHLRGLAIQALSREGRAVKGAAADLLRRLPALRAHGTGAFERERLKRDWLARHRPVELSERRLGLVSAATSAVLFLTPLAVLGLGLWLGIAGSRPGAVVAAAGAAMLAALAVRDLTRWQRGLDQAGRWLAEFTDAMRALEPREAQGAGRALPSAGALVASGISAYDPRSGSRISGIDCTIPFPAHVALLDAEGDGARILASLIAGQIDPTMGRLTFGGMDLAAADPAERARRIAFAGGETILLAAPLRDNLRYGSANVPEPQLMAAVTAAGLDGFVHARGLAGTLDPRREAGLAAAIVEARREVRAVLRRQGLDRFVEPFDPGTYNNHSTLAENLLFGHPVGQVFREDRLAAHPYVRAVLEAADLAKPLTAVGLSIAASMVEIFADIPAGHPLFERYAFFRAEERGYFEDLIERRAERRREHAAQERERLIGLALRYVDSRHRLGLLDEGLKARIVEARADFARMLPPALRPAIEFFDAERFCAATSIQDNLLFGRLAADQAGAEEAVHAAIRCMLTERGLDGEVVRIGLDRPIDPRADELSLSEAAAIDLVRCLVRDPVVVVAERALDGLTTAQAQGLLERLRRHLAGRGLVIVAPSLPQGTAEPPLDLVLRFERGVLLAEEPPQASPREAVPA